jgi:hypothetical protein
VYVYVRNYREGLGPAVLPDPSEFSSVKLHDAVRKALRIDIVVVEEFLDAPHAALVSAEEEGAGLATSGATAPELIRSLVPKATLAHERGRLTGRGA